MEVFGPQELLIANLNGIAKRSGNVREKAIEVTEESVGLWVNRLRKRTELKNQRWNTLPVRLQRRQELPHEGVRIQERRILLPRLLAVARTRRVAFHGEVLRHLE